MKAHGIVIPNAISTTEADGGEEKSGQHHDPAGLLSDKETLVATGSVATRAAGKEKDFFPLAEIEHRFLVSPA